jgi:hypothetical protein
MIVINLFAGPGAGKSTTAAGLFYLMKRKNYNVELITEYAKELTWKKDFVTLANQEKVTEEQFRRQDILKKDVAWAITDSPLLCGLLYGDLSDLELRRKIFEMYNMFENEVFYIMRTKPYNPIGRNQTEEEAKIKDKEALELLHSYKVEYTAILDNDFTPARILKILERS